MAKIRDDVVGVFYTVAGILKAGDEVPEGVKIHPSWLASEVKASQPKGAPSKSASTDTWKNFLESEGIEFPNSSKRDDLVDLWESTQG